MVEGKTLAAKRRKKEKRSWGRTFLPFLALWFPYWLWTENDLNQKAKPAVHSYLEDQCAQKADRTRRKETARCLAVELDYLSANVGAWRTKVAFSIREADQSIRRRCFRLSLSWATFQWTVTNEIECSDYYWNL